MDRKLRQLENQSLPDLSKLDQHWQQMLQQMQPGNPDTNHRPAGKGPRRWWPWLIAACIVSMLVIIGYQQLNQPAKKQETVTVKPQPPATVPQPPAELTSPLPPPTEKNTARTPYAGNKKQVSAPLVTKSGLPVSRDTAMPAPAVTNQPVQSKKESITLAGFFQQLEKKPQEIRIDPGTDNLVKGIEGTALLIPAHTFTHSSTITIELKEYYTYEDIITNRLSTTSNGEPLVTGGMIHLRALADGKEIPVNPGKTIRWFIPDTSQGMGSMELFTGQTAARFAANQTMDTMQASTVPGFVNWVAGKQSFTNTYLQTSVKVLDLKDNPYRTRETKKGVIGKFHISNDPKISRRELVQQLKDKYGYYKVKLRNWGDDKYRVNRNRKASPISGDDYWVAYDDVGDSAWISSKLAARYRLKATDSVTYTSNAVMVSQGNYIKNTFARIDLNALTNRYSVDIRTLGWINCDRFYRNNGPRTDYILNLPDTATNYFTILVFDKMKSMMQGYASGNRVIFPGLPKGIAAKVMCVGIRDGQPVAAVTRVPAEQFTIEQLQFEAITPASFRDQAAMINK